MTDIPVWMDQVAGVVAIVVLVGGILMMLTNVWTMK
jgi:hypothetical protein